MFENISLMYLYGNSWKVLATLELLHCSLNQNKVYTYVKGILKRQRNSRGRHPPLSWSKLDLSWEILQNAQKSMEILAPFTFEYSAQYTLFWGRMYVQVNDQAECSKISTHITLSIVIVLPNTEQLMMLCFMQYEYLQH